jgi:hypothetical protein
MWTLSSFSLARPPEAEHLKGAKRLRLVARAVESVLSEQEVLRRLGLIEPSHEPRPRCLPGRPEAIRRLVELGLKAKGK